jgi:small neutral amino acid transporter SnatA (MarC family)
MELQILPLAITMMAGPQTMSGIILVSHSRPIEMSLSFITGIAIATSAGLLATVGLAVALDTVSDAGQGV